MKQSPSMIKEMAHNTSNIRPSSADSTPPPKSSSMLYSMFPSALQSRLPSLRRSTSMYGLTPRPKSADSSGGSSGSRTPEAGYGNAMIWSRPRSDEELYFTESSVEMSEGEDIAQTDKKRRRQTVVLEESKSGIGWKFASQGLNLLSLAAEESSIISRDPRFGNASFSRQLYLHAVIYLLRALPADLTTEEQLSVRSCLPAGVVEPLRLELNQAYASSRSNQGTTTQPSLLHRTLASTIVQLFILFQFILPHLKYLLSSAYQYERRHKISERILSESIDTVDALGKRGLSITETVLAMGDGKVGHMMAGMTNWLVEGVTGGIHEGLGEGMVIIGARRRTSEVMAR